MNILLNCFRLAFPTLVQVLFPPPSVVPQILRSILTKTNNFRTPLFEEMGKTGFYAVARGNKVGVFHTWDECKAQVIGVTNSRFKKFSTNEEALSFIKEHEVITTTKSDATPTASTSTANGGKNPNPWRLHRPVPTPSASSGPILTSQSNRCIYVPAILNKRSLKVTEDIVTGRKRAKLDIEQANADVDRSQFTFDDDGYVVVYTDGACSANGKGKSARAGIGVWFEDNHNLNIAERVKGRQTNNTAEIMAAERAILQAKSAGIGKLMIKTDSQFTINCATKWLKNWKRNGWKRGSGEAVKNQEDLEKLDRAMEGMEIKWSYVKAHNGIRGNEGADRLAVEGSNKN